MPSVSNGVRDVSRFDPSSWVPLVRPLTPKTRFITLAPHVVTQLTTGPVRIPSTEPSTSHVDDTWSDGTPIAEATEEEEDNEKLSPDVEAVRCAIDEIISELNGAVCPKLGSRCPFDATWAMISRNTRCDSANDVLTLISASERAAPTTTATNGDTNGTDGTNEVPAPMGNGREVVLSLRQWANIDNRRELRCFIRHGTLTALCPRRWEQFSYADETINNIVADLTTWLRDTVHPRVSELFGLSYIVDVYAAAVSGTNWVIDFGGWRGDTDPLVFSWDELETAEWMNNEADGGRAEFRAVNEAGAIRPADDMYYGLPLELRNADSAQMLAEAAQSLVQQEREDDQKEEEISS